MAVERRTCPTVLGHVCAVWPDGLTAPDRMFQTADPPSSPGCHAATTAAASSNILLKPSLAPAPNVTVRPNSEQAP